MSVYIDLKDDRSEKVRYDYTDFPVLVHHNYLSAYPNYCAPPHWHDDIEFIIVQNGEMSYNINGEIITIKENEGVFVNSRQMHFGFSDRHAECDFICALIHPVLLCITPGMEQKYVLPVLQSSTLPFLHLTPQTAWHKEITAGIERIHSLQGTEGFALKAHSIFTWIWSVIYENVQKTSETEDLPSSDLSVLKNMIGFIQQHYAQQITLQQIAVSGGVGQSKCCKLFNRYLHQTPNAYLISYRLNKGTELLAGTDKNITEIAYEVGFNGASYFAEAFRKCFKETPSEYRENYKKQSSRQ